MRLKQLRKMEAKALERFLDSCRVLISLDSELQEIHNQLDSYGEQSNQPYEKRVLMAEARTLVLKEEGRQRKIEESKNPPVKKSIGKTYTLSQLGRRRENE